MSNAEPLISVVTPFFNTARFLPECIESVLNQRYRNFEYLLVDNQSTDGGGEIALDYAKRDARIRVVRTPQLLTQANNYNFSLKQISQDSRYCKIVQADDWIFDRCLADMADILDKHSSVGVVASYRLAGKQVLGTGVYPTTVVMSGRDACRLHLLEGICMFGSPTTVMYRSELVRARPEFFVPAYLHDDTERVFELLAQTDFALVHQVLSYSRVSADSISGAASRFTPDALDLYIVATRHGQNFLDAREYDITVKRARAWVYGAMARALLWGVRGGSRRHYLEYQRRGLATLGQQIEPGLVARHLGGALLGAPLKSIAKFFQRNRTSRDAT